MSRPPKTRGASRGATASRLASPTESVLASAKPPAARRSQAERRDASRSKLLQAAFELVAERGFRGTSFAAIALRAGHSPSLVSHQFGSKEGLLGELVRRMVHRWGSNLRAVEIENRSGTAALAATAQAHRRALEQHAPAMRAMYMLFFESLIDAPELRTDLARLDEYLRQETERMLQAAVDNGTARKDLDVGAHATLFLAALRGITLQWMMDPAALDLERVYAALDSLFDRGLR